MFGLSRSWDSPYNWADITLAVELKKWADDKAKGQRFNLYNDLCKIVRTKGITGTVDELKMIATRSYSVNNFGPVKYDLLDEFLKQRETTPNQTYFPE